MPYSYNSQDGYQVRQEPRGDAPKGLGDFQRRLNRDREWGGRRDDRDRDRDSRGGSSRDAPSVRVPNVGWDSTPRSVAGGEEGSGWGRAKDRRWDAPTPRVARAGSPDEEGGAIGLDMREWEEEQVNLDREWYTGAEDGGMAGDDEHNPLAQYEDIALAKQAEIAKKQTVRSIVPILCMPWLSDVGPCRRKFLLARHSTTMTMTFGKQTEC